MYVHNFDRVRFPKRQRENEREREKINDGDLVTFGFAFCFAVLYNECAALPVLFCVVTAFNIFLARTFPSDLTRANHTSRKDTPRELSLLMA